MIGWPSRSFVRQLDAGDGGERRHQVEAADDVVVLRAGRDLAGHPGDGRNAVAAFAHRALGAAERRVAGVGIDVLPGAVVGRVEDERVLVEAERADLVHDAADPGVELDDRVGVLALGQRLVDVVRVRHVRLVHLHEVDVHEERLGRLGRSVEIVERRLLDVAVEERNADDALASGVSTYWPLILKSSFAGSPGLARQRALGHPLRTSPAAPGPCPGTRSGRRRCRR